MKKSVTAFCILLMVCLAWGFACGDDDDDSTGSGQMYDDDGEDPLPDDDTDDDTDDDVDDDANDDTDDDVDDDDTDDDVDDDVNDDLDDDINDDADDDADDDAFPACNDYGPPQIEGNISHILNETSGLVVSTQNPGVLWGHNDSGDGPKVYAMTLTGDYLGTVTLTGASASDWEDMTLGPCGMRDGDCLYLGDHGDNGASRTNCAIYRLPEPVVDPDLPFGDMSLDGWERFPFSYPDGPRDAEALAIHPDGSLYVFSKYPGGTSEMYAFPPLTEPEEPVAVTHVGDLDTGEFAVQTTTAADIHPGGRRLILRTYITAWEWRLDPGAPFHQIISADRFNVPTGLEVQGESIAYDPATGDYLHASERIGDLDPPIYRISCAALR